jgi:hypothetical protein
VIRTLVWMVSIIGLFFVLAAGFGIA